MTVIKNVETGEFFERFGTFTPIFTKDINKAKKFNSWYDSECLDICNLLDVSTIAIETKEK